MGKGYIVFYKAELLGVLEDKEEYKRFKAQRPSDNYDYAKLTWKEIMKVVGNGNLGNLQTVTLHGLEEYVVFANEYEGLIEYCYMELNAAQEELYDLFSDLKTYIKFTEEESVILNGTYIVMSRMLKNAEDNGVWFEDSRHGLSLRPYVEAWLQSMNWDDEYE